MNLWYTMVILVGIFTGTVAQSISAPGDVVEGRPFTLQCRINRGGDADLQGQWSRAGANGPIRVIYQSYSCDSTIELWPGAPDGFSGRCQIRNGEEIYSLIIDNVLLNMDDFAWKCSSLPGSGTPVSKNITLSVKVIVTSVILVGPSTTVVAGTPTTFTCTTSRSKPEACAKWFIQRQDTAAREITTGKGCSQDLITLQTTSTLQFTGTAQDNGAKLYCTAINSVTVNAVQSLDYTVNVQYLPLSDVSLTGYVTGTPVESSLFINLSCSVGMGNPLPTLTWASACGSSIVTDNNGKQPISLTATPSLNGETCMCQGNQAGTKWTQDKSVTFNIAFGPDSVTFSPGASPIEENSRVTITCTSGESNPAAIIALYYNNTLIPTSEITSVSPTTGDNNGYIVSGLYSVKPTRYEDGHILKCETYRPERQDRLVSSELTLDVQYGPMLISCNDSYTVVENQSIKLSCTAWAKPKAQLTWTKTGNSYIHTESGLKYKQTSKISFPTINKSDSGIYVFTAMNGHGTLMRDITVTVQYAPTVTVDASGGTEVTEGENLELECQAEGVPQSYTFYPWAHYVGDMEIPLNNKPSSRLLQIRNVTFKDQGFYECSAANDIGRNRSRTEIKIKATPKFPAQERQAYSALNANAKIRIGFVSFPPATEITWFKADNISVPLIGGDSDNNDRFTKKITDLNHNFTFYDKTVILSGQVVELEISGVTRTDLQTYILVVENSIGHSNFTVSLNPADHPCPPFLNAPVCEISKADISWVSCFNGGYEQHFFIEIKKGDEDWTPHPEKLSDPGENNTISSEILDLETSQTYSFRIKAKNKLGQNYSAEESCSTVPEGPTTSSLTGPIAGGAAGGILVVIIIVGVFIFRRRIPFLSGKGSPENDKPLTPLEENPPRHGNPPGDYEDVEGFESRPDVVAAGVPAGLYAVVDKGNKPHTSKDVPAGLYADVKKPQKKETPDSNGGPIYAQANKPAKKANQEKSKKTKDNAGLIQTQANKPTKEGKEKKGLLGNKKKASKTTENNEETYANAAFDAGEVLYSNTADTTTGTPQEKKEKVEGELMYADMDFARDAVGIEPIIHPSENNTTYAGIQYGVVGPPAPEDDDEEEDDLQNQ